MLLTLNPLNVNLKINSSNLNFREKKRSKNKRSNKRNLRRQKKNNIVLNKKKKEIRCGGIILNQELNSIIIVLNRQSMEKGENKWGLPKGHIKPGEPYYKCAEREIKEETGLIINIDKSKLRIKINDTFYYVIIIDDYKYTKFSPNDQNEIAKVNWESIKNIKNLNINRGLKKLLNIIPKIIEMAKKDKINHI